MARAIGCCQSRPASGAGARLADGQPDVQGHWSNTIGNHNNFTRPQGGDDGAPGGGRGTATGESRAEPGQRSA